MLTCIIHCNEHITSLNPVRRYIWQLYFSMDTHIVFMYCYIVIFLITNASKPNKELLHFYITISIDRTIRYGATDQWDLGFLPCYSHHELRLCQRISKKGMASRTYLEKKICFLTISYFSFLGAQKCWHSTANTEDPPWTTTWEHSSIRVSQLLDSCRCIVINGV